MPRFSDLDHLEIDASVYPDRTEEVHQVSDIRRGLRRVTVKKVWRTEKVLGRGSFGQVHLQVQDQEPNSVRAVKVIPTFERMSKIECERELIALIEFTKPKYKDEGLFVTFLGWFQTDRDIHLAMEYMPLGDLEVNLRELEESNSYTGQNKQCVLKEDEVQLILSQVLEGVRIMHAEGFAHRDLKPQNLLVVQRQPRWWIKIGDFGLSKKRSESTMYRSIAGTQPYMAPELFYYVPDLDPETTEDKYTNAIDIWALGCITYRILTGKPPFPQLWSLQRYCYNKQQATPISLSGVPGLSIAAENFVQSLLTVHPANRLTADDALQHSWLKELYETGSPVQPPPPSGASQTAQSFSQQTYQPSNISNNSQLQSNFNYNSNTHQGLQSYAQSSESDRTTITYLADGANPRVEAPQPRKDPPAKPLVPYSRDTVYPEADAQRMKEPMPNAFNVGNARLFTALETNVDEAENRKGNLDLINGQLIDLDNVDWGALDDPISSLPSLQNFYILIVTFSKHRFRFKVNPNETIKSLKHRLTTVHHLPTAGLAIEGFRLNFDGQLLQDHRTVRHYGMDEKSVVNCRWILVGNGLIHR